MRYKIGLTGSIGMGKSTTAQMFADAGCAVWDADAAVHRLYAAGGAAVTAIGAAYPDAIVDGAVDRARLRALIEADSDVIPTLERIVHPLVAQDRAEFIAAHPDAIGVFDIPLLFETGGDAEMDATVCVQTSPERQEARVLARARMTRADLARILARQMPSDEKCARATYVVPTDTLDGARAEVHRILSRIEDKLQDHA